MNNHKNSNCITLLAIAFVLLVSACQPAVPTVVPEPTQPSTNLATEVAPSLEAPTQTPGEDEAAFTLNYAAVARDMTIEEVEAHEAVEDDPYWVAAPRYHRLTLEDYLVTNHVFKPQIFVYPVGDLASANEAMGQIALDLQTMLDTRQAGDKLPFLPLSSDTQGMHTQVQYLDFNCGNGVRFLTEFNNGIASINNTQLIYTFQGLTCDGKYYISAVLPVTSPELPDDPSVDDAMMSDFQGYISNTAAMLNQLPADHFSPGLDALDAMIRSMEFK